MADPRLPRQPRPAPAPERSRDAARDNVRKDKRTKPRTARDRGRARSRRRDISDVRTLTPAEREIVSQVGRFRSIAINDFKRHMPKSLCNSPARTVKTLKELGLVRSQYIKPHATKETRKRDAEICTQQQANPGSRMPKVEVVVLTHKGAEWLRANGYDESLAGKLRPGLAKPREAFHDAHLYTMAQREIETLKAHGATNINILTDSALKQKLYQERARLIAEGRTQQEANAEAAATFNIPMADGKCELPDVRLDYEMPDGSQHTSDLELVTDTYSAAQKAAKDAAGFTSYHMDKGGSLTRGSSGNGGGSPWDEDWMTRSMSR